MTHDPSQGEGGRNSGVCVSSAVSYKISTAMLRSYNFRDRSQFPDLSIMFPAWARHRLAQLSAALGVQSWS